MRPLMRHSTALSQEDLVFVIGGGEIYRQMLAKADRLYLTIVDGEAEADTFFPEYEHLLGSRFTLVAREDHEGYRFEDYVRDEAKERKRSEASASFSLPLLLSRSFSAFLLTCSYRGTAAGEEA